MAKKTEVTYAELVTAINEVVGALEQPDIDVDKAIELYERGIALTKQLDTYLAKREHKLIELKKLSGDS